MRRIVEGYPKTLWIWLGPRYEIHPADEYVCSLCLSYAVIVRTWLSVKRVHESHFMPYFNLTVSRFFLNFEHGSFSQNFDKTLSQSQTLDIALRSVVDEPHVTL